MSLFAPGVAVYKSLKNLFADAKVYIYVYIYINIYIYIYIYIYIERERERGREPCVDLSHQRID